VPLEIASDAVCASTGTGAPTVIPAFAGRAQAPSASIGTGTLAHNRRRRQRTNPAIAPIGEGKKTKSLFAEDGPVDTAWAAQIESFWHVLVRLPVAAFLSSMPAFRPRRRGTPKRQAPVIQTQIVLALVGAMVMMVGSTDNAERAGVKPAETVDLKWEQQKQTR